MNKPDVRVGIGVFVCKDGKFLFQQRQGSHGAGSWSVPGGHLEHGESFEDTARREVKEETDLDITNLRFAAVTNDVFPDENKHYVTIWMISDWAGGELVNREPEKCKEQRWVTLDTLPQPLFIPWNQLLTSSFIDDIRAELQ